jgi:hypothetical protein
MSIVRPDDYIAVGKTPRGSFIAYHQFSDDIREYDDCDSFLFKHTWIDHDDDTNALIAARRLLTKLSPPNMFTVDQDNWWWADRWRIFPLQRQ